MAKKRSNTKQIACEGCGEPLAVDVNAESGTCYKCLNMAVTEKANARKRRTQVTGKATTVAGAGSTAVATKKPAGRSGHMTPEAIRSRFDNPDPNRKLGFFQEVFNIIKSGTKHPRDVAEAAFKLDSCPARYTEVSALEEQVRWYCKGIWGKRTSLVRIDGDEIEYLGSENK